MENQVHNIKHDEMGGQIDDTFNVIIKGLWAVTSSGAPNMQSSLALVKLEVGGVFACKLQR